MALGTFTIVEQAAAQGPIFYDRCTIVGDGAYAAGGTPAFQAAYRAAAVAAGLVSAHDREIVALLSDGPNTDDGSGGSGEVLLQYDHANDKLKVVIAGTGAESAQANQSGVTYNVTIVSK